MFFGEKLTEQKIIEIENSMRRIRDEIVNEFARLVAHDTWEAHSVDDAVTNAVAGSGLDKANEMREWLTLRIENKTRPLWERLRKTNKEKPHVVGE